MYVQSAPLGLTGFVNFIPSSFTSQSLYWVSIKKQFTCLVGCEIKSMLPIFKTRMLIYQSKTNLDVKILFGKITHPLDPTIENVCKRNGKFHFPFWSMSYVASQCTLSVSEIEFCFQ